MRNPGCFPQYGAIFMANNSTRKECFERELFGLPYEFADFVMEVKIGMLLFLFDFQERKLYGVFTANSNGMMNIVPDAYNSTSKKKFPAQVRFSTLWHCDPLPEPVFHDAIKENYYKKFKFTFGLSRDQVKSLLYLFQKKRIKVPGPFVSERQQQTSNQVENSVVTYSSSPEDSESMQESTLEVEDYIPLPSIEPGEIDDASDGFLCEAGLFPIWSFAVGGTDDDKEDDTVLGVQGLYSDKQRSDRTSAFLRLSGLGKVLGEEHHHCSNVDNVRDILKEMDERHKKWKCNSTENGSISRVSVFSRLSCNVRKAPESQQRVTAVAGEMKPMDVAKESTCLNSKCTSSCEKNMMANDLPKRQLGALENQQTATGIAAEMKAMDVAKEFIHQTLKRKETSSTTNAEDYDNLSAKQYRKHSRKKTNR
ncbi:B2 protein [Bienertia sinuspersici]